MAAKDTPNYEFISQTGRTLLTLRELVLRGEFAPGERLLELALAARLSVSRTPVRLALDRLSHEGLLEPAPSGGFVVRQFTLDEVWDAIETRGVLEGMAARFAAERITDPADLDPIRAFQAQMDAIEPKGIEAFVRYMDLNERFHQELANLAKSTMLARSLTHVNSLPFAAPSALVFARAKLPQALEMFILGQEQHHSLIEAVAQRHGTRAQAIAWEHARLSRRNLESALSDKEILSCVPGSSLISVVPDAE
jgi:GntR family transcriptional regulator of vanillate catabolism